MVSTLKFIQSFVIVNSWLCNMLSVGVSRNTRMSVDIDHYINKLSIYVSIMAVDNH